MAKSAKAKKPIKDQSPSKVDEAQLGGGSDVVAAPQKIDLVRGNPEEGNESAETVQVNNKPNLQVGDEENAAPAVTSDEEKKVKAPARQKEACWNCKKDLDSDGNCSACGFEKSKLYNLGLEAERSRERALREGY